MAAKTDKPNPKDLIGSKKVDLFLVPDGGLLHAAMALTDGAFKYGAYNWRDHPVRADIYITAARRHLMAWAAGEELAPDSEIHHLGHAMACLLILVDAQMTGNLIDNRQRSPELLRLLDELNAKSKARAEKEAAKSA